LTWYFVGHDSFHKRKPERLDAQARLGHDPVIRVNVIAEWDEHRGGFVVFQNPRDPFGDLWYVVRRESRVGEILQVIDGRKQPSYAPGLF
jgi:hypothetical protein